MSDRSIESVCLNGKLSFRNLDDPVETAILKVRATDTDGYGNKLNFNLISISINGSPPFIASREHFIDLFDEILEKAGE